MMSYANILALIKDGANIKVNSSRYMNVQLLAMAKEAAKANVTLELSNAKNLYAPIAMQIAKDGKGRVVFNFTD